MGNTKKTTETTETEVKKLTPQRHLEITQYERNPKTGEDLHFGESNILKAIHTHKTIKRWSYVRHDHDLDDGKPDFPHWHCYIDLSPARTVEDVAKWFGVPEHRVKVKNGKNPYLDCTQYYTHEREPQKSLYPDSCIKSSHDWRKLLAEREEERKKYGTDGLSFRDKQRIDVLRYGKTLRQCKEEDILAYIKDMSTLQKCRAEYLWTQPAPKSRVNFYVCGGGGIGKGQNSRALARALFPELKSDEEIFFEIGGDGVSFEGYDGQPVIIWNDFRSSELLWTLGSRSAVFNVFDTIPTNLRQNVKYSSVKLLNCVNIVNSVEPYSSFCDGLAGEYKGKDGTQYKAETDQKQQAYRRFPFGFEVLPDRLLFTYNVGYVEHNYYLLLDLESKEIHGNAKFINEYVHDQEQKRKLEQKLFAMPTRYFKEAMEYASTERTPAEGFFDSFGETV